MRTLAVLLVLLAFTSGCATFIEKRTAQGPTAVEMFTARVKSQSGREPTFEERGRFEDQMDQRMSRFLAENPQIANSPDIAGFRHSRQVVVGMPVAQVVVLLGGPESKVTAEPEIEKLARRYWPHIKGKAREVWLYPGGWRIFIGDGQVVDMIQYLPPGLRFG